MDIEKQIEDQYGLKDVKCVSLHTLVNDVYAVESRTGRYALKVYIPPRRTVKIVEWEMELVTHLYNEGAPVVKPVKGHNGFVELIDVGGKARPAVLYEWAPGEKPEPGLDTYMLLGRTAAQIHAAADSFRSE